MCRIIHNPPHELLAYSLSQLCLKQEDVKVSLVYLSYLVSQTY